MENSKLTFRKNRYFKKVLLSIITLIVVIIFIYASVTYIGMKRAFLEEKNSSNMNELAQANYTLDYLFEMTKNLALYMYQDEDLVKYFHIDDEEFLKSLDYIRLRTKMNDYVHTFNYSSNIVIYNSKLDLITSTEYSIDHYNKPLANAIRKYINHDMKEYAEFAILDYSNEKGEEEIAFFFGLKDWKYITEDNQTTIGILIKPEWIFNNLDIINNGNANQEKEIYILNNNMELYSSDARLLKDEKFKELKELVINSPKSSDYFDIYIENVKYKATYIRNDMCKWTFISIQPYNVFLAHLYDLIYMYALITLAIILIALVLAVIFANYIYVPVYKVVNQIRKNKNDNNSDAVDDELSFIVNSYDKAISQISMQQTDLRNSKKYIKIYWLKRMLMESHMLSIEEIKKNEVEALLNINLFDELLLIILSIDKSGSPQNKQVDENQQLYRFAIENIAYEVISESFACNIVEMDQENIVILINVKEAEAEEAANRIEEYVRKIQQTVNTYYAISLSAVICDKTENYSHISNSYKKALHLLSYKLIYGHGCILKESMEHEILETNKEIFILQKEQKLENLITGNDEALFKAELDDIFENIKKMKYNEIMSSINYLSFLFYKIIKINFPMQFNEQIQQMSMLNQSIYNSATLDEIKDIFINIYLNIHNNTKGNVSPTNNMLVRTIIQIIEENYKDPNLSQEWIASTLKLSYSTIGKTFKMVENTSIAEYINRLRLKCACDLLENSDYNVGDIFSRVGFINQSYFFTLFKKYFGCTPKQYQLQKKFKQFE